jgi:hypothetical protein
MSAVCNINSNIQQEKQCTYEGNFKARSRNIWHDFRKKELLNIKFVFLLVLQHLSEAFLILRRTERHMIKNVYLYIYQKCIFVFM